MKARSHELKARLSGNSGQRKRKEAPADEIKAKVLKTTHTLVVEHERSSADRPGSATQSSVCHGSLGSAVRPVIEHVQSIAERLGSATPSSVCPGALIDKFLLAQNSEELYPGSPRSRPPDYPPPGFRPKPSSAPRFACQPRANPATPLYDQFLADLEEARQDQDGRCLLAHIEQFCFFGDMCNVNAYGERLEQPIALSAKMEDLLIIALAQRREIAVAAGLSPQKLAHHQATPSQMEDMIDAWRKKCVELDVHPQPR